LSPETNEKENYPWYTLVEPTSTFKQGDIVKACPLIDPSSILEGKGEKTVNYYESDSIILSQSCDLEHGHLEIVLVSPLYPLEEFKIDKPYYKSSDGKEELRRRYLPGYFLLNECNITGFISKFRVVDFHNVYGIPFNYITRLAKTQGQRLRLLPPYRESLAQEFAKFFARVGYPVDIPEFATKKTASIAGTLTKPWKKC